MLNSSLFWENDYYCEFWVHNSSPIFKITVCVSVIMTFSFSKKFPLFPSSFSSPPKKRKFLLQMFSSFSFSDFLLLGKDIYFPSPNIFLLFLLLCKKKDFLFQIFSSFPFFVFLLLKLDKMILERSSGLLKLQQILSELQTAVTLVPDEQLNLKRNWNSEPSTATLTFQNFADFQQETTKTFTDKYAIRDMHPNFCWTCLLSQISHLMAGDQLTTKLVKNTKLFA